MPLEQKPDCPRPLLDRFSNLQKLVPTKPCPCRYRTDHHAAGIRSRSQLQGPVPGFPLHACTLHHWQRTLFCVVDRIAMAIVLPSNQIFFVDICGFTSVNPLGHWCVGLHLSRASRNFSFSPSYIEILVCGYGKLPAVTSLWNLPRAATRSSWICLCKRPTWPKA